jgi:hypothetical protein
MERDAGAAPPTGDSAIVNSPCPSETQRQPAVSPAFRLSTSTRSETMNAE